MLTLRDAVHAYYADRRWIAIMMLVAGIAMIGVAVFFVSLGFMRNADFMVYGATAIAAALLLPGAIAWKTSAKAENTALYRALTRDRDRIVWVHKTRFGYGRAMYFFFTDQNTGHSMQIATPGVAKYPEREMLDCFEREFPFATIGWSEELASSYKRDPRSLRRSASGS